MKRQWRFSLRKRVILRVNAEELKRLERENEEARRGRGNPFDSPVGLDPLTKVIGTYGKMSAPTSIIGTPIEDQGNSH